MLALTAIAGGLAYRAARSSLEEELGRRLQGIAQTIAAQFTASGEAGRIARLEPDASASTTARLVQRLEALREGTGVRRIFVFRPDAAGGAAVDGALDGSGGTDTDASGTRWTSLLDTSPETPQGGELFELEADRTALLGLVGADPARGATSTLFADDEGARYLNGYAPVRFEGETVAIVAVAGSAHFFAVLDTYRAALLSLGVLVALLVTAISVVVSHRLTEPISRLVEALQRYGRGEQRERLAVASRDEIGIVAMAFNDMRDHLDRRDEQMQMMLSGIAHEVRNPLAGMALFCSILDDELRGDPERREYVRKISRELEYLGRVVTDFLTYARRRPLSPERFRARTLVEEVADATTALARGAGVRVEREVDDELELTGEREALRGLLVNLVQNAVQACAEGGTVRVRVADPGPREGVARRRIEVEDDGCGMPPEVVHKIFEPFYTTRQKGTGLGLALAHKTVRDHGGEIEVDSEMGRGTRVGVILPFDLAMAPVAGEPEASGGYGDMEMIG